MKNAYLENLLLNQKMMWYVIENDKIFWKEVPMV